MRNIIYCLLIASGIFASACGEHLITIEQVTDIPISDCALFSQTDYIINDMNSYNDLLNEMLGTPECVDIFMPPIDFAEKTLLGKLTSVNSVCSVTYTHEVFANSDDKKFIYRITIHPIGTCSDNYSSMNWITIPKMPNDYTIEYEIN